jgi:hypothetical protein
MRRLKHAKLTIPDNKRKLFRQKLFFKKDFKDFKDMKKVFKDFRDFKDLKDFNDFKDFRVIKDKNHKNSGFYFVLCSACTISAGAKMGCASTKKTKTLVFILFCVRLALSLHGK